VDALVSSSSGKEQKVDLVIRVLSVEERRKKALKALGICWLLALGFAPLPPIHWVLTPGFFLAGPFVAWKKYLQTRYLSDLAFPCPECGKEMTLPSQPVKNPKAFSCKHCGYLLKLAWKE
jgi:hypothetical protein